MRTHPIFLCLVGRPCVVIGADDAGASRAVACLRAGADVTVIGEAPVAEIVRLAATGRLRHEARPCRPGDLRGAFLAYVSTRDRVLAARLAAEAAEERVLLNVLDVPDACTFYAGAIVDRDDLQVAIGTGGASPGLAARLRRELEAVIGPEYAPFVTILGAVRRTVAAERRAEVVAALLGSPLLDLVRRGRHAEIDALLGRVVGADVNLAALGVAVGEPA